MDGLLDTTARPAGTHPEMPSLSFVPFDAFWIVVAGLLLVSAGSLARLRSRHRRVWLELGSPGFLPWPQLGSSAALTRFYWSRRVAELGDPDLSRWVTALRLLQLMLAGVLASLAHGLLAAC